MKYAIIENGKVSNIVVAEPDVAAERGWVELPNGVGIGWIFDGAGTVLPPSLDTEAMANEIRTRRNQLLAESDISVLPDRWASMTSEQQQAWSNYRQALRDIPAQGGFPNEVTWPQKPE